MYVQTYEAETIEDALKVIKKDLGPDAVILKTATQRKKGNPWKRGKVKVTAAITERDYVSKAKTDNALDDESKEKLYKAPAKQVSAAIKKYAPFKKASSQDFSRDVTDDDLKKFLSEGDSDTLREESYAEEVLTPAVKAAPVNFVEEARDYSAADFSGQENLESEISTLNRKMREMERGLQEKMEGLEDKILQPQVVSETYLSYLGSTGLHSMHLSRIVKQYSKEGTNLEVKDFALEYIYKNIKIFDPFSSSKDEIRPIILINSPGVSGQSMAIKMASKLDSSEVIFDEQITSKTEKSLNFIDCKFAIKKSKSESVSHISRLLDDNITPVLTITNHHADETALFVKGILRAYPNASVIFGASSLWSCEHLLHLIRPFEKIVDGVYFNFFDMIQRPMNLLNFLLETSLPVGPLGVGPMLPDHMEVATKERMLEFLIKGEE